jgi:hypothetical protein
MRDSYQEYQAESLSSADTSRQLEQQIFVMQIAAGGGVGQYAVMFDSEAHSLGGFLWQTETLCHLCRGLRAELVQKNGQIEPITTPQRAPHTFRERVTAFGPLMEAAQREEAMAIESEIVGRG